MSGRRLVALIILATLLFLVMSGAQLMLAARNTILQPAFIDRHVASLSSLLDTPATHDLVVRAVVTQTLGPAGTGGLSAEVRERVVDAVRVALAPTWIKAELTRATRNALSVLRGRGGDLRLLVDLSSPKEIVARELSGGLPTVTSAQIRASLASIPDVLPVDGIVGTDLARAIQGWGRLFIPLSLLLVFVGPASLVIACQLVGGIRHGLWVAGAATLGSALVVLAAEAILYRGVGARQLAGLIQALPPSLTWLAGEIRAVAKEVRGMAGTISVSFGVVGGSLATSGVAMAVFARKANV